MTNDLGRKIIVKLRAVFFPLLIKGSVYVHSPRLTAAVLALISGKIDRGSHYTALVLGRSIFYDDISAMAEFSGKLNYVSVHKSYWAIIYKHFTHHDERAGWTEANYHITDHGREGKRRYYLYLKKMFPYLRRYLKIDAVISGNFGYLVQQELAKVCVEDNIPFLVLHKEGLSAGIFEGAEDMYVNRRFVGHKFLAYNEKILGALLGKVKGLAKEQIKIVGVPRLDYYFQTRGSTPTKQIVLFSFYVKHRLPRFVSDPETIKLGERRAEDFHLWVMNYALKHPEISVVIKTKAAGFYLDYVQKIKRENFSRSIPNLTITSAPSPRECIESSFAVLGYLSTTLIEGLLANRLVISPYFGDLIPAKPWDYFTHYPELVSYAKTERELEKLLDNPERHFIQTDKQRRDEFLTYLIHTPDGQASIRAEAEIINTIREFAHANSKN